MKFYASIRLEIRSSKGDDNINQSKGVQVARDFKIKVVKNKVSPPFRECSGIIKFGEGIDKIYPIYSKLLEEGIIIRGGGVWKKISNREDIKQFSGYAGFKNIYLENKSFFDSEYFRLKGCDNIKEKKQNDKE
jgi:recombination protein RecA